MKRQKAQLVEKPERKDLVMRVLDAQSFIRLNWSGKDYDELLDRVHINSDGLVRNGSPVNLEDYTKRIESVVRYIKSVVYYTGSHLGVSPYKNAPKRRWWLKPSQQDGYSHREH